MPRRIFSGNATRKRVGLGLAFLLLLAFLWELRFHRPQEILNHLRKLVYRWSAEPQHNIERVTFANSDGAGTPGNWEIIGGHGIKGSWDSHSIVRSMAIYEGNLLVGIGGMPKQTAEVWRFSDSFNSWHQIGGNGIGESWHEKRYGRVNVLLSDHQTLYAGIGTAHRAGDAELWRYDGLKWRIIGGPNQGWEVNRYEIAYSAVIHDGNLYIGMTCEDNVGRADVFRFDGTSWQKVGAFGKYNGIYKLETFQGDLYAATWSRSLFGGTIWRLGQGGWQQVAGDGKLGSWSNPGIQFIQDLSVHDGYLIASVQRDNDGDTSSVWAFNEGKWKQVGVVPPEWQRDCTVFNSLETFKGTLCVGIGGGYGRASVWGLNGHDQWKLLGGFGINGSWSGIGETRRNRAKEWVYRLLSDGDSLYVGLAGNLPLDTAEVWRYRVSELTGGR